MRLRRRRDINSAKYKVKKEFRGKGIGRRLAEGIIKHARQRDFHYMRLVTYKPLVEAISLYTSLGFEEIDRYIEVPLALEQMAVFMELKLV